MQGLATPLTWLLGIVLTVVGILGFFMAPTLIVFQVDTMHNLVHLFSGIVALLAVSSGESGTKAFLKIFGVVYGLVAVLGFIGSGSILGLFMVNGADNLLHVAIAVASLAVGFGG